MDAAVAVDRGAPGGRPAIELRRVCQLGARDAVGVEVDDDGVPVLYERDRPPEERFRCHMADDEADRSAGETRVGHETDGDSSLAAEGGDPGRGIQQLRHAWRSP